MTGDWNLPAAPAAPPPLPDTSDPVRLLIVAQAARAQALYTHFASDARFAVQAIATDPADARAKLTYDSEVALVELVTFAGPAEFGTTFAAYRGAVAALAPATLPVSDVEAVRQTPCVSQVLPEQSNLPELAGVLYDIARNRRTAQNGNAASFAPLRGGTATIGFRSLAVWSPQGGVGKSTLALALALEATQRRIPTLLVGLGAPDGIPLILDGIRPDPNILNWQAAPSHPDGLRAAIQIHKRTGQHILVGFRAPTDVGGFEAFTGPTSISNLAFQASMAGYALVVLDVSTQELAPAALSAANTLVLVGRADLPGIRAILEGVSLVKDKMAGQHAIPDGAIHLVLNRVRDTTLRPDEVISYGKRERRDFPPLAAVVADDPNVEVAINRMEPAYYGSDSLRRAAKGLGNLLFPAVVSAAPAAGQPAQVKQIGRLRIKL